MQSLTDLQGELQFAIESNTCDPEKLTTLFCTATTLLQAERDRLADTLGKEKQEASDRWTALSHLISLAVTHRDEVGEEVFEGKRPKEDAYPWILLAESKPFGDAGKKSRPGFDAGFRAIRKLSEAAATVKKWSWSPGHQADVTTPCRAVCSDIDEMEQHQINWKALEQGLFDILAMVGEKTESAIKKAWKGGRMVKSEHAVLWLSFYRELRSKVLRPLPRGYGRFQQWEAGQRQFGRSIKLVGGVEDCESCLKSCQQDGLLTNPSTKELEALLRSIRERIGNEESPQFSQLQERYTRVVEEIRNRASYLLRRVVAGRDELDDLRGWAGLLLAAGDRSIWEAVGEIDRIHRFDQWIAIGAEEGLTGELELLIAQLYTEFILPAGDRPVSQVEPLLSRSLERIGELAHTPRDALNDIGQALGWVRVAQMIGLPWWRDQRAARVRQLMEMGHGHLLRLFDRREGLDELRATAAVLAEGADDGALSAVAGEVERLLELEALMEAKGDKVRMGELYRSVSDESLAAPLKEQIRSEMEQLLTMARNEVDLAREGLRWCEVAEQMGIDPGPYHKDMVEFIEAHGELHVRELARGDWSHLEPARMWASLYLETGHDTLSKAVDDADRLATVKAMIESPDELEIEEIAWRFNEVAAESMVIDVKVALGEQVAAILAQPRTTREAVRNGWWWCEVAEAMELPHVAPRIAINEAAGSEATLLLAAILDGNRDELENFRQWAQLLDESGKPVMLMAAGEIDSIIEMERLIEEAVKGGLEIDQSREIIDLYLRIPDLSLVRELKERVGKRVLALVQVGDDTRSGIDQRWRWSQVAVRMGLGLDPKVKEDIDYDQLCQLVQPGGALPEATCNVVQHLIVCFPVGDERMSPILVAVEARLRKCRKDLLENRDACAEGELWLSLLRLLGSEEKIARSERMLGDAIAEYKEAAGSSGASSSSLS